MAHSFTRSFLGFTLSFLVFWVISFTAPHLQAQSCSACTYTSSTGSENYNLSSGNRICIPNGVTFRGSINGNNVANASICIAEGGVISNASLNNFAGTIYNYGTATFTNGLNFSANNQTIENYGRMTISSINFNARGIIKNLGSAHLVFTQNLTLSNGSELYNEDTVIVQGNLNGNSNNVLFDNKGFAIIQGSYASSGITNNSGFLIASQEINNNSGGVMTNNCSLIMDGNFNNNNTVTNNGNILLIVNGSRFQNNSGAVFTNGANGYVQGTEFLNNGQVKGQGGFRFTGVTRNNGGAVLGQSQALNFYDTGTPVGGLDFQTGTLDALVTFNATSLVDRNDLKSTCSSNLRQALPVEFGNIEADFGPQGVTVSWSTFSEISNDYFEVQRSVDGLLFESVGTVAGKGDSRQLTTYSLLDRSASAFHTTLYYRIRQVDFDGLSSISNTVEAIRSLDNGLLTLSIFPNPATETVNLELTTTVDKVEIFSLDGRRVFISNNRENTYTVSLTGLNAGIYFVSASLGSQRVSQTLVVKP